MNEVGLKKCHNLKITKLGWLVSSTTLGQPRTPFHVKWSVIYPQSSHKITPSVIILNLIVTEEHYLDACSGFIDNHMCIGQNKAITIHYESRSIAHSQRMTFIRDEQDAKIAECSNKFNALIDINIFDQWIF